MRFGDCPECMTFLREDMSRPHVRLTLMFVAHAKGITTREAYRQALTVHHNLGHPDPEQQLKAFAQWDMRDLVSGKPVKFHDVPRNRFPFKVFVYPKDEPSDANPVWTTVVSGPGTIQPPTLPYPIRTVIRYADGTMDRG